MHLLLLYVRLCPWVCGHPDRTRELCFSHRLLPLAQHHGWIQTDHPAGVSHLPAGTSPGTARGAAYGQVPCRVTLWEAFTAGGGRQRENKHAFFKSQCKNGVELS